MTKKRVWIAAGVAVLFALLGGLHLAVHHVDVKTWFIRLHGG